jgi:hypothetical protein
MNFIHLLFFVAVFLISDRGKEIKVIPGHAHNDYENERPLLEAIENGFISVEVDVHLMEDNLYVSHDLPQELLSQLTLEKLYLDPLKDHIEKNNGFVYPSYSGVFYLMIDFKSPAEPTYDKLKTILSRYRSILTVIQNGVEEKGPVKIFISGNRPIDAILQDDPKLAGIDGRPGDLVKNIPVSVMPVVSDNYFNILRWNGNGEINKVELEKLKSLVQNTHAQNKKLRLWASPDNPAVWKFLLDNGLDMINTDELKGFQQFSEEYYKAK